MERKESRFDKLKVSAESERPAEARVMKVDTGGAPSVRKYEFGKLRREGEGSYSATKAKYGALAATDPERTHRGQRDRRFGLNPLVKAPLSIEEEERRVIDEKVEERIAAMGEEARKKGLEEGYHAGLQEGHREAFARFQQEAAERMAHFESMLREAETAKQEIFRGNERFLMETIFRLVRMITLKELSSDREYVLRLARDLVERMGVRENIRIRIHPSDAETAQMIKPALEKTLGALQNVTVEASPAVRRGGCTVETEWNAVDASLDQQFEGIYAALVGEPVSDSSGSAAPSVPPSEGARGA